MRAFLHPFFAWLHAMITRGQHTPGHPTRGRDPYTVWLSAYWLQELFRAPAQQYREPRGSSIHSANDAGVRDIPGGGPQDAYIGGCYTMTIPPTRADAQWFYTKISSETHSWAYTKPGRNKPGSTV